jgi:hypothetical protein
VSNPIDDFAYVLRMAQERVALGHELTRERTVSESAHETLDRLRRERAYVVVIIDRHFKGRENHVKRSFDFDYKENLPEAIEHVVSTTRHKALHDALEAVRAVMDDKKERRPGHVMAEITELMKK